jgi:fructan beta-fructosidase
MNPGGPQGGSATQYFIGDFTGSEFKPDDSKTRWLDMGADNYASVSWSDVPETDGRRLIIGWMSNWQYATEVPTQEWRSAMTIPRELTLDNEILKSLPVEEFEALGRRPLQTGTQIEIPSNSLDLYFSSITNDLNFSFSNGDGEELIVSVSRNEVAIDRSKAGISDFNSEFAATHKGSAPSKISSIRVLLDHSSIEVFANRGELVLTDLVFPNSPYTDLSIQGECVFEGYELSRIWNE